MYIMEGMLSADTTETETVRSNSSEEKTELSDIQFAYCTEFLINNPKDYDIHSLRRFFSDIGDCPAVAEHSGIIKIHVHTNSPDKALAKGFEIGELSDIKIDNMRYQASSR